MSTNLSRRGTRRMAAVVGLVAVVAVGVGACRRPGPGPDVPPPGPPVTTTTTGVPEPSVPTPTTPTPTSAPRTTTTTPPGPGSVRGVDLDDATYPTAACPEAYRMPGATFTLRDGFAGALPDGPDRGVFGLGVERKGEVYGDLDGDGREDVAVHLMCGIAQSDGLSDGVAVMTVRQGRFEALASIPASGVPATGIERVTAPDGTISNQPVALDYELVADLAVVDGQLRIHWWQSRLGGDALGSGYDVTVTYRIADGRATIVRQSERVPQPFTAG